MLPNKFRPFKCSNLVRLGSKFDGGYIVDSESVKQSENFISLGICDNWDFENDVKKYIKFEDHFYFDNQLSYRFLTISFLKYFFKFKYIDCYKSLLRIVEFKKIKKQYTKVTIGYDTKDTISLKSIFENHSIKEKVFLKCDIEGSEYRILNDIIKHQNIINGICIEFHDVDLNLEKIENFIDKIDLNLCHIHANNFSGISPNGIPMSLELTFTRFNCENIKAESLPLKIDNPNNPLSNELTLMFLDEKTD